MLLGLPAGLVLTICAAPVWFMPLRAGLQVFAAFDADFTRDAWEGPSYLGAPWMDGVLSFYAASDRMEARATENAAGDLQNVARTGFARSRCGSRRRAKTFVARTSWR